MKIKLLLNIGSRTAKEFELDAAELLSGAEVDLPKDTAAKFIQRSWAVASAGETEPPIVPAEPKKPGRRHFTPQS